MIRTVVENEGLKYDSEYLAYMKVRLYHTTRYDWFSTRGVQSI